MSNRRPNPPLRIVTWNCNRAGAASPAREYLLELAPDGVLLQEYSKLPERVAAAFNVIEATPRRKQGGPQRFKIAVLVRGAIINRLTLSGPTGWLAQELEAFAGNLLGASVRVAGDVEMNVICVYSPAWPVSRDRLTGQDVSEVKLTRNPDVWVTDLLWAALKHQSLVGAPDWVIAGDFNSSETFDHGPRGDRGNREYLDRMAALGLTECLRRAQNGLTPTYQNKTGREVKHQLDHMFVTAGLASRLVRCETGSQEWVFGGRLSDHLPIIADFRVS